LAGLYRKPRCLARGKGEEEEEVKMLFFCYIAPPWTVTESHAPTAAKGREMDGSGL